MAACIQKFKRFFSLPQLVYSYVFVPEGFQIDTVVSVHFNHTLPLVILKYHRMVYCWTMLDSSHLESVDSRCGVQERHFRIRPLVLFHQTLPLSLHRFSVLCFCIFAVEVLGAGSPTANELRAPPLFAVRL